MGIYYAAVDWDAKELIEAPEGFSDKSPGIFSPKHPFPGMVTMKNLYGSNFVIVNDACWDCYYDQTDLKNITEETYQMYLDTFPWAKEFYD